jgi:group I intron endonuclease
MQQEHYFLIYKHTCVLTGKSYIGQRKYKRKHTPEYSMLIRWNGHCNDTFKNNSQLRFHQKIREFGKENFEHELLEILILNQIDANVAEMFWINWYGTKVPNGYNLTLGGGGTSGHKQSKETVEKRIKHIKGRKRTQQERDNIGAAGKGRIPSQESNEKRSKALKGRKKSEQEIENMKLAQKKRFKENPIKQETKDKLSEIFSYPVICYTCDGEVVGNYKSIDEADKSTGVNRTSISRCCKMSIENIHYPKAGGFIWRSASEPVTKEEIKIAVQKRQHDKQVLKETRNRVGRRVAQFDMNMNFICEFNSIQDAARKTGVCFNSIGLCCRGVYSHAGHFIWKYIDEM